MAGPTDVLTEDVKDLRAANRELTDEMKRVFDRLSGEMWNSNQRTADAMRESNQRLVDAINRLGGDFSNFRVEVAKESGRSMRTWRVSRAGPIPPCPSPSGPSLRRCPSCSAWWSGPIPPMSGPSTSKIRWWY